MTQLAALKWNKLPVTNGIELNVKNHSVVHYNNLLYVFGGNFEDRMDILIFDTVKKVWCRVKHQDELNRIDSSSSSTTNSRARNLRRGLRRFSLRNVRRRASTRTDFSSSSHSAMDISSSTSTPEEMDQVIMTGPKPPSRNGHTATLVTKPATATTSERAFVYIIGGWLGNRASNEVLILEITNPKELEWIPVPRNRRHSMENNTPPGPCNMHSAEFIPHKREIYVFRGGDGTEYLNDLHALNVDTLLWRKVDAGGYDKPPARADHASAYMEETKEMFIFGGWDGRNRLNDFYILDTDTDTWTRPSFKGEAPHARAGMTLSAVRDRLYLFGGNGVESSVCNDLHVFDRTHMEFLQSESEVHTSNGIQPTLTRKDSNSNPNCVTVDTISKLSVDGREPSKRAGHTATVVGRFIYVIGGSSGQEYRNDCHALDTDNLVLPPDAECTSFQMMSTMLKDHFNSEHLSDVVFIVEGRRIYAHKIVLSLTSEVYRAMFLNPFREKSDTRPEIEVPDYTYDNFITVLEYMYTGEIDLSFTATATGASESIERILSLLEIADHLLLDHLKQRCERALFHAVNATSIEFMMQFAQHSNAKHLEAMCLHFERNQKLGSQVA